MKRKRLVIKPETVTFDEAVGIGRKMLADACIAAAKLCGEPVPQIITEVLSSGNVRMVVRWRDGEETNECVVQRIGDERAISV